MLVFINYYMATCFGCITAIVRPTLNIACVHVMCARYGIPYRLRNWYI